MKLQFKGVLGDEGKKHPDWQKFAGKKLRITVEVIED